MRNRIIAQVVALVVVTVFAVGIWATGGTVDTGWLQLLSAAVFLATLVLNLWDWVLWGVAPAQRLRSVPRDVRGTWKGELTSFWEDPDTGERPTPKTVYLVIRQTASAVSAVLLTDEAKSYSTLARVLANTDLPCLEYLYEGRPDSRVEYRSRAHRGAAVLDVAGTPASRLKGRYWTDRDSRGELAFTEREKRLADDYSTAASLF
jgi:hypothetical protein